jgi:hypothetical protein
VLYALKYLRFFKRKKHMVNFATVKIGDKLTKTEEKYVCIPGMGRDDARQHLRSMIAIAMTWVVVLVCWGLTGLSEELAAPGISC